MWRCSGRWKRTRPQQGEAQEPHHSGSQTQYLDTRTGRQQRPGCSPHSSCWEVPLGSSIWNNGTCWPPTPTPGHVQDRQAPYRQDSAAFPEKGLCDPTWDSGSWF